MAQTFAVEETIERPAREVWDALTDWTTLIGGWPAWTGWRLRVRP